MISVTRTSPDNVYDKVDTHEGTAGNSYSTAVAFAEMTSAVILVAKDNPMYVKLGYDGIIWSDAIYVPADVQLNINFHCKYWSVKNVVADNNADYVISGLYHHY